MRVACDVVVVGGGPSGLAAALELALKGVRVAVIEEAHELGGQYYRRRLEGVRDRYGDYRPYGTELIERVRRAGVECHTDRVVWGLDDGDVHTLLTSRVHGPADPITFTGQVVIVATGAYEWLVPFPGYDLAGVVTPGYALHLATCDRLALGQRIVVGGTGPFLLVAAAAVLRCGGGVAAVVELNRPYRISRRAISACRYPSRMAELAGYMATLWRHRVPILQGWRIAAAHGTDTAKIVTLVPTDRSQRASRRLAVDGVAVGYGFQPATELLRLMGAVGDQDELGTYIPQVGASGLTSLRDVYVVGEAAGVAGVRAALSRGVVVADAITTQLGLSNGAGRRVRRAQTARAKELKFARLTRNMYPVDPSDLGCVPDATIVCRCEGIKAEAIRRACGGGWASGGHVKAVTRAGMGACQGRQCELITRAIIAEMLGTLPPSAAVRMPLRPVSWSAATGDSPEEISSTTIQPYD